MPLAISPLAHFWFVVTNVGAVNQSWSKHEFILPLCLPKFDSHLNWEILADSDLLWRLQLILCSSNSKECC